jgi:hypothetical protein
MLISLVNYQPEVTFKEAVMAQLEVPPQDLSWGTEGNYERPQSIFPVQGYEVLTIQRLSVSVLYNGSARTAL